MNKLLCALSVLFALAAGAQSVRYRTTDTVYLDAGSAAGIKVGDRYEVVRNNAVIATIEVIFVAERSSSAKVINETTAIVAGDKTVPSPRPRGEGARRADEGTPVTTSSPLFSLSGTATADFESGDTSNRSLGRLTLRARNIADLPLHARVRTRASSEMQGNRLYEASLSYEGERIGVRAGRIGNTPYVGLGYLDGALVRVSITDNIQAGAFGGVQPNIRDLSFDADATKFGGFVRVFGDAADLVVAAATVNDNPFIAVDGTYRANDRISFYAHGRAGDQAFNTMIGMITQLTPRQNITVSYERVDPGPDDDLRSTDQVINDFLRQGVRATYRSPYVQLGGGIRSGDEGLGDEGNDPTYSVHAGVSHPNVLGLYAGISATGFSSQLSDGLFAQARAGHRFGRGHTVEVSAGAFLVDETALEELSTTAYVRGELWLELPYDLFGRAEVELTSGVGDGAAGHRVSLGAGYRF